MNGAAAARGHEMLPLTVVVLGLAGLSAALARPQEPFFVRPDYIEAVESLPVATEPPLPGASQPLGPAGSISLR